MKRTIKARVETIEGKCRAAEMMLAGERLRRVLGGSEAAQARADLAEARASLLRTIAENIGMVESEDRRVADRIARIAAETVESLQRAQDSVEPEKLIQALNGKRPKRKRTSGVMARARGSAAASRIAV